MLLEWVRHWLGPITSSVAGLVCGLRETQSSIQPQRGRGARDDRFPSCDWSNTINLAPSLANNCYPKREQATSWSSVQWCSRIDGLPLGSFDVMFLALEINFSCSI